MDYKLDPIEYLEYLMKKNNLRQGDLVNILNVRKGTVSKILSKKSRLSLNMIRKLHKTFNIPYDILMND